MFSGAHRLLDAGVCGPANLGQVTRAALLGILIAGLMRVVLFLAVLGVVQGAHPLSADRPVFDAFQAGAGRTGVVLSGLVYWAAAITSVVGCSYTSI
jgi:Mn2+/Fe2+ NRAMP family transporter